MKLEKQTICVKTVDGDLDVIALSVGVLALHRTPTMSTATKDVWQKYKWYAAANGEEQQ